jgi:aquaporin Z
VRRYVTELIGTFALVFTIGCTVKGANEGVVAPLAIGGILMAMVYAGGHISGAHYNPAVSLAMAVRGRLSWRDLPLYWVGQLLGAVLAAFAADYVVDVDKSTKAFEGRDIGVALLVEFLFTVFLAYVVLNVATSREQADNGHYGLAIGFTVMAGAFAVGPYSGAAFNPAVAVGGCIMDLVALGSLWVYFLATLAGGAAAALTFKALNPEDS